MPRRVGGLLAPGRPIDGDRVAHAASRNVACCVVTGQVVGIAAALSAAGRTPRQTGST